MWANIGKRLALPGAKMTRHDMPKLTGHVFGPPNRRESGGNLLNFPTNHKVSTNTPRGLKGVKKLSMFR